MKLLRIGRFLISTNVNGPGRRFVIWFQGCPIRCKGCFNPEFLDENGGLLMRIEEIITQINSATNIEGVTFTGGEPFIQAETLLPFAESIKAKGLSIVCYTGYLLKDILKEKVPYAKRLLKLVDILIDGKYIEEEKAPLLWRGSRNQKVHFFTQVYKNLEPLTLREGTREAEIKVKEGELVMTGIFETEVWERLKEKVNKIYGN